MKYIEQNLNENEKILESAKISYITIIPQSIAAIIFLILAIVCFSIEGAKEAGYIMLIPFVVELIRVIIKCIKISTTELCVTSQRIVRKSGIVSRYIVETSIDKIDNVSISQTFWDRIFKIGTIKIETTSEPIYTQYVSRVNEFKGKVIKIVDKVKQEQKDELAKQQAIELAKAMKA